MEETTEGTIDPEAQDENEQPVECGNPCAPESPCVECADYWDRMVKEGFWDAEHHEWTNKGMREILRQA